MVGISTPVLSRYEWEIPLRFEDAVENLKIRLREYNPEIDYRGDSCRITIQIGRGKKLEIMVKRNEVDDAVYVLSYDKPYSNIPDFTIRYSIVIEGMLPLLDVISFIDEAMEQLERGEKPKVTVRCEGGSVYVLSYEYLKFRFYSILKMYELVSFIEAVIG